MNNVFLHQKKRSIGNSPVIIAGIQSFADFPTKPLNTVFVVTASSTETNPGVVCAAYQRQDFKFKY